MKESKGKQNELVFIRCSGLDALGPEMRKGKLKEKNNIMYCGKNIFSSFVSH